MYGEADDCLEVNRATDHEEYLDHDGELTNSCATAREEEYTYLEDTEFHVKELCKHYGWKEPKTHNHLNDEVLRAMYSELQLISAQLKSKNLELSQRERQLQDRELRLGIREDELELAYQKMAMNLHRAVGQETAESSKKSKAKVTEFQDLLKEKVKEGKRLRANFDALQEANSQLRKQSDDLQCKNTKLEKQCNSLKQRLENLQRCQELKDRQTENVIAEMKAVPSKPKPKASKVSKALCTAMQGSRADVFVVLLDWTIRDILRPSAERGNSLDGSLRSHILDNCQKMLPSLVELLKDPANQSQCKICLPCLQFIYWSCLLLDQNPGKQNVGLGQCQRKLAEELYRPLKPSEMEITSESFVKPPSLFIKSSDTQIKLLSCLLLLKTLTQADWLANVFVVLKQELREELVKELFVHYNGSSVLLSYFKPTSKAQLPMVLDIYMLMCVESSALTSFLQSCGTESWFRSLAMVLKIPSLDVKQLEKISVVLQKLSKLKENRKHFETFALKTVIQDILHTLPSADHSFLALNFKSVLFNITSSLAT
ncbi:coiled-coil domain-containing protein 138-like [Watersipora subatra]|uniref:coiled-coil domain-containing protein 138-like n=1 Tax=Watersipora subatra TaxID=2589382 RepID=UPI00355B6A16